MLIDRYAYLFELALRSLEKSFFSKTQAYEPNLDLPQEKELEVTWYSHRKSQLSPPHFYLE